MVIEDENSDADYEDEGSAGEEEIKMTKHAQQPDRTSAPITMVMMSCSDSPLTCLGHTPAQRRCLFAV